MHFSESSGSLQSWNIDVVHSFLYIMYLCLTSLVVSNTLEPLKIKNPYGKLS